MEAATGVALDFSASFFLASPVQPPQQALPSARSPEPLQHPLSAFSVFDAAMVWAPLQVALPLQQPDFAVCEQAACVVAEAV